MKELDEYKMHPVILPSALVTSVIADLSDRMDGWDAMLLDPRRLDTERKIRDFTAEAIRTCEEQNSRRVLLPRDLIGQIGTFLLYHRPPAYIDEVEKTLMRLRLDLGAQLLLSGAVPIVEEGLLKADDFYSDRPRRLKDELTWSKTKGGNQAVKINNIDGSTVMTGPRPIHRFLQEETVYSLSHSCPELHDRYGINYFNKSQELYATMAEHNGGKKTIVEDCVQFSVDKYMMDMLNAMEAIHFLHQQNMVHRDVKPDNIFDGGVVFDNLTVIKNDELKFSPSIPGTKPFMPVAYNVAWPKRTPYYGDIFAFAISVSEGISIANGCEDLGSFYSNNGMRSLTPDELVQYLKFSLFSSAKDAKSIKTLSVVKKMILGMGEYTLADAQRDLSAVFGATL